MAEGRVADVMREAECFRQIFIQPQRARNRAANLRHLKAVGQADAIMIAVGRHEHLCLVAQTAKRDRVDDPVPITLEDITRATRLTARFGIEPTPAIFGQAGIRSEAGRHD